MLFVSLDFAAFFLVTFGLYVALPARFQNGVLLLASLYAYYCWKGSYLGLVVFSGCLDYGLGWRIARSLHKRAWLALSLVYNLAILAYFKYGLFLAGMLVSLGFPRELFPRFLEMPVGISFFTFQSMAYAIDIYRGKTRPAQRLLDYLLFVSFFAQMMCGPIERARGMLTQLATPRKLQPLDLYLGSSRILWGLFQKLVVADNLALPVTAAFARYQELSSASLLCALLFFAIQLYTDFCGYTDIALGLAQMLGLRLSENFRAPYLARSFSDFWSRWNSTLMAWFRDYLYFPLAGRSEMRALATVLLVFSLSGLWHGAAWHFLLWGLFNGSLVVLARLYSSSETPRLPLFLNRFLLLSGLLSSLILFRSPSIREALAFLEQLLLGEGGRGVGLTGLPWEALWGFALVVWVDLQKEPRSFSQWFLSVPTFFRTLFLIATMLGILLLGAKANVNFLYLQF